MNNLRTACCVALLLAMVPAVQAASINVSLLDSYETSLFNASASEITAYSPVSGYFFVTSSATNKVDVLQLDGSNNVTKFGDITLPGGGPNSVAVYGNVVAVAVQASVKTDNGTVEFYDATTLAHLNSLTVGALPDMLVFTPDGSRLLVANEAEPNDAYTIDPVGTVSIISMADGAAALDAGDVATVSFAALTMGDLDSSTRVFGPGASIAQDFEPEYIAVDPDGTKAYVTLQENNAIAIIDIASATLLDVVGLGFKDHSLPGNYMDSSDRDPNGAPLPNIISRPVLGMYQPDAIASFLVDGQTYLITANEGDTRGWTGFNEEARVSTLDLDDTVFPTEVALKNNNSLGRLTVTNTKGKLDEDGDNAFEKLYVFGTRSFSIWNSSGTQVYDSGDDIEQTVLALDPTHFNVSHDDNNLEGRSDNKGPEPEAATVAKIGDKTFAFIGLERQSAILVYDVSIPTAPVFEQYLSNRNFAQVPAAGQGGDLGPEGILFVPASQSPNGNNLLVVSNEVSGSTTFYNVDVATSSGDLSGDGIADILWRNETTKEMRSWTMDGANLYSAISFFPQYSVGNNNWQVVAMGDINHDGFTDIVFRDVVNGYNRTWIMNAVDGTVSRSTIVFYPQFGNGDWVMAGAGDMNGDGTEDLLFHNSVDGKVRVWEMDSNGNRENVCFFAPQSVGYEVQAIDDFDGDRDADIFWRNPASGANQLWRMQGCTVAQTITLPVYAGSTLDVIGAGDFNGDGTDDLLWSNSTDNSQSIWGMVNGNRDSENALPLPNAGDLFSGVADYDANGTDDILYYNSTSGYPRIWWMNNFARSSHIQTPTFGAGGNWSIINDRDN